MENMYFDEKIEENEYTIFNGDANIVYDYLVENNIQVDHI